MRGSSLVETLLAVFILVIAVSFSALSFHRSMRYQTMVQNKAQSLAFSDLVLDQIREWSRTPANFRGPWTGWASVTNPTYPDYEARVRVADQAVAVPCTELALGLPLAQRRSMATSLKSVEVSVFHNGQPESRVNTLIGEPERLATTVTVTPVSAIPNPLARDGVVEFEARALDSSNNVIPDVFFQWTTAPLTGNGSVISSGPGTTALLSNVIVGGDGTSRYTGGQVRVRAFCVVRGREVSGQSPPVILEP